MAAKFEPTQFNGVWANTYSDGIGGTVTDTLALLYDEATGTITGDYKTETGQVKALKGKITGREAALTEAATGDDFAGMKLYNPTTLKLDVFTGTFKRVTETYRSLAAHPDAPAAQPASAAACQPAQQCTQPKDQQCDSCKQGAQCPEGAKQAANVPACCQQQGAAKQATSNADAVAKKRAAAEAVLKAAAAAKPIPTP